MSPRKRLAEKRPPSPWDRLREGYNELLIWALSVMETSGDEELLRTAQEIREKRNHLHTRVYDELLADWEKNPTGK